MIDSQKQIDLYGIIIKSQWREEQLKYSNQNYIKLKYLSIKESKATQQNGFSVLHYNIRKNVFSFTRYFINCKICTRYYCYLSE